MSNTWRKPAEEFLDNVELERVNKVIKLLKIEDAFIIDSYAMSANGPIVTSVFLVDNYYLVEVHLSGKNLEFDSASINTLVNYRIIIGEDVISPETRVDTSPSTITVQNAQAFKFISVTLRHSDKLISRMSCFGNETDAWLQHVLDVMPRSILLKP